MSIQPVYLPATISNPISRPALPELPHIDPPTTQWVRVPKPSKPTQTVVLVSGVMYPKKRGKIGNVFGHYCERIAPTLHTKYPDAKIQFFCFFDGNHSELTFDAKGKLAKPTVIKAYGALNKENYRYVIKKTPTHDSILTTIKPQKDSTTLYFPGISDISTTKDVTIAEYLKAFDDGTLKERSISLRHVYEYIIGIGKTAPGSLVEFHIFSHAYDEGPILVNTLQYYDDKDNLIDDHKYLDKDGRFDDFGKLHFDAKHFRKAFAPDAYSVLWGCLGNSRLRAVIKQVRDSKAYQTGEAFKDRSKPFIQLLINPEWDEEQFHEDFLDVAPYPAGKTQAKSIDNLADAFTALIDLTYPTYLTTYSEKSVRAALPGTAANLDHEITQTKFGLSLMHIFMGTGYLDPKSIPDYRKTMEFYKKVFGFKFEWIENKDEYDKEYKRGYAVYNP